jgi:hypothetical protein
MQNRLQIPKIQIPKSIIIVINQLYELEQKLKKHGDPNNLQRNLTKMKDAFAEEGMPGDVRGQLQHICLSYEDPMGQSFKETRTDLDATISGSGTDNLVVVEVIKPIIRSALRMSAGEITEQDKARFTQVIQKGVVIVESQKEKKL